MSAKTAHGTPHQRTLHHPHVRTGGRPEKKIFPPDDESSWFSKKGAYLNHAWEVSYIMQGKSGFESALGWFEDLFGSKKPRRVQSFLGGAFLRMYLEHKVDPDTVAKAGIEIGQSSEFKELQGEVNGKFKLHLAQSRKAPTREEIARFYGKHLDRVLQKKGIKFKHTLNAVIGGVSGVKVEGAQILSQPTPGTRGLLDYQVAVNFADTYDFENKRVGVYERYRQRLAYLLSINDFGSFEREYHEEAMPWGSNKTQLDNAAVFASFMYALERKGWTPGPLSWSVTVPMRGSVLV